MVFNTKYDEFSFVCCNYAANCFLNSTTKLKEKKTKKDTLSPSVPNSIITMEDMVTPELFDVGFRPGMDGFVDLNSPSSLGLPNIAETTWNGIFFHLLFSVFTFSYR